MAQLSIVVVSMMVYHGGVNEAHSQTENLSKPKKVADWRRYALAVEGLRTDLEKVGGGHRDLLQGMSLSVRAQEPC